MVLTIWRYKKVSYAASIGREVKDKKELNILKKYLSSFSAISVRENSAKLLCNSLGFNQVQTVIDPTLLLEKIDYLKIANIQKKDKYILIYILNIKDKAEIDWENIEKFAKSEGLHIRVVMSCGYYPAKELIPGYNNEHLSVENWLGAIYSAEYVITTSFHGAVFSIIMNKNFIAFPP